jgi:hypothetical protein
MIWILVSIPFWLLGFWFFPIATLTIYPLRRPDETEAELARQFLTSIFVGGVFLLIAAGICQL